MANVRTRSKAPKSASNTKTKTPKRTKNVNSKVKKQSAGTKPAIKPNIVMKRPSTNNYLTAEEKIQFVIEKGHVIKDKLIEKNCSIIKQNSLITKSGRIKKNNHVNLRFLDHILKRELLIEKDAIKNKTYSKSVTDGVNNNDDGISDQNKSESDSSDSQTPKKGKSKSNENTKSNKSKLQNKERKSASNPPQSPALQQLTFNNGVVLTSLPLVQCDYCQKTFSNKSSLRRHIYMHLDLKPYPCTLCTQKFRQRCNLQDHIKRRHPETNSNQPFVCDQCDKPFVMKKNLLLHMASHVKNENTFACVFCNKSFPHHLLLSEHEKEHLGSCKYMCSLCNMSYDCQSRLSLHIKSHLKIKDYVCQYCGKEFLRPNSIRRHVQICHGGLRIQCPICKKHLKGHLTEHMRTHDKKRPHECPDCGQKFTQSTQMKVHRRCHTGARPYPCRICDRAFTHSNALMLHIRRHTGEKPFPCAMCPMLFSQLPHMKAHMRKIHGIDNPYKCKKCMKFFKLKAELETHAKGCTVGDRVLSFEEQLEASILVEDVEVESVMSLSRMRFLLALLLTMIATKEKLKYLGFNKRPIDDLLVESLEAMGHKPCKNKNLSPIKELKFNIELLLNGTVPKEQMDKFKMDSKTTEEILELLTDMKKTD